MKYIEKVIIKNLTSSLALSVQISYGNQYLRLNDAVSLLVKLVKIIAVIVPYFVSLYSASVADRGVHIMQMKLPETGFLWPLKLYMPCLHTANS